MLKIARLIKYLYIPNKFYLNVHPNIKQLTIDPINSYNKNELIFHT